GAEREPCVFEAEGPVPREGAPATGGTEVVGAVLDPDGPQQGHIGLGSLEPLEPGRFATVGAAGAGALVAFFLRCSTSASIMRAAALCTRSRIWNSVAPRSCPSGREASNSAICRSSPSAAAMARS